MHKILTTLSILFFPNFITKVLLNLLGHKIHATAYIGFSVIQCRKIYMDTHARIGHLNLIQINKLLMRENAYIKSMNRIRGDLSVMMGKEAAIANDNSISRASSPVTFGNGTLKLGRMGTIVSKHRLDITRSITIGDFTTIGGLGTQFWTHGYYHGSVGKDRIRIDGEIIVGNNVYVGSSCTFNPGVKVADAISIGSNVCVSRSLKKSGMYVAQPLRYIEKNIDEIRERLDEVVDVPLVEEVYEKKISQVVKSKKKIKEYEQVSS